jgi:hypothetical protein
MLEVEAVLLIYQIAQGRVCGYIKYQIQQNPQLSKLRVLFYPLDIIVDTKGGYNMEITNLLG